MVDGLRTLAVASVQWEPFGMIHKIGVKLPVMTVPSRLVNKEDKQRCLGKKESGMPTNVVAIAEETDILLMRNRDV